MRREALALNLEHAVRLSRVVRQHGTHLVAEGREGVHVDARGVLFVLAVERATRGDDELNLVPDDDGVVDEVPVVRRLEHRPSHELPVAVAVARVGVLPGAADLHRALVALASLGDVAVVPALVDEGESVKRAHHPAGDALHHALRPRTLADERHE